MRLLLPTGIATAGMVRKAAEGHDARVVVTGEIASFLTPEQLASLVRGGKYDLVLVSGMCTASFERGGEGDRGPCLPRTSPCG